MNNAGNIYGSAAAAPAGFAHRGFSLIELLLSIILCGSLALTAIHLFKTFTTLNDSLDTTAASVTDFYYAMQRLEQDCHNLYSGHGYLQEHDLQPVTAARKNDRDMLVLIIREKQEIMAISYYVEELGNVPVLVREATPLLALDPGAAASKKVIVRGARGFTADVLFKNKPAPAAGGETPEPEPEQVTVRIDFAAPGPVLGATFKKQIYFMKTYEKEMS